MSEFQLVETVIGYRIWPDQPERVDWRFSFCYGPEIFDNRVLGGRFRQVATFGNPTHLTFPG
jgi:hypothetical protein